MSTPAAQAYAKTTKPFPAPLPMRIRQLTIHDRCDRCGGEAWVRTESYYSTNSLMWCAHHFTEYASNGHFSANTHSILDERPFLTAVVKAQAGG